MKKYLLLLFVCIALFSSAKVYTLYYGPNHDGKYLEIMIHGDEAIAWTHDSIPGYSHARVEKMLNDPHLWRIKFEEFNESDNTLIFLNTFHNPIRKQLIFSNDFSTLEIKDLRKDTEIPSEKLELVKTHIDPRSGKNDFIGDPNLPISVLNSKDKSSEAND